MAKHDHPQPGDLADGIATLKQQRGKDIVVTGSGELVWSLMGENLVDEYRLFVAPAVRGHGKRLFPDGMDATLHLLEARAFRFWGVVLLRYQPTSQWRRSLMARQEPLTTIHPAYSDPHATATPWAAGAAQLEQARVFWISTVRPDGRPHVTPLIAVWLDGALYFCTGASERKAKNIEQNAHVILTTGRNTMDEDTLDMVVEGDAVRVRDAAELHAHRGCLRGRVRPRLALRCAGQCVCRAGRQRCSGIRGGARHGVWLRQGRRVQPDTLAVLGQQEVVKRFFGSVGLHPGVPVEHAAIRFDDWGGALAHGPAADYPVDAGAGQPPPVGVERQRFHGARRPAQRADCSPVALSHTVIVASVLAAGQQPRWLGAPRLATDGPSRRSGAAGDATISRISYPSRR